MVDKTRGEAVIVLDGKEYTLVPEYKAIVEIEGRLDKGLITLIREIAEQRVRIEALAVILSALVGVDEEEAGNLIMKTGFVTVATGISTFLINAISGGEKAEPGNGKAGRK